MSAVLLNVAILILEVVSFIIVIPRYKAKLFIFYTMLSNLCAAAGSAVFLILGRSSALAIAIRYNATVMLVLTFIIANFVLIPIGIGFHGILVEDCGFNFHMIAPILSVISYEMYENHVSAFGLIIPILVTCVYGIIIVTLVYQEKIKAPYPFVEVRKQSIGVSAMWVVIIFAAVTLIGWIV